VAGAEKQYTVRVIGDASSVKRSFRDAETASDRFARKMKKVGAGMSGVGDKMTRGLTLPIVAGAALSVKAASDLQEAINKTDVVFGDAAKSVHAFAETASDSIGQSRAQAEAAASTFGNLFKTMGMSEEATLDMSMAMVELASDLSSFHNIPIEEALTKLQSGLVGESEPMRQLGVLLNETTVKQEAYRMGLAKTGDELTEQQKVQARYSLILQQTGDAQGDFARTSGDLANKTRTVKAQITDVAAEMGTALIPVAEQLVGAISSIAKWFGRLSPGMQSFIVKAGLAVAAIGPLLSIFGRLISVVGGVTKAFAAMRATAAVLDTGTGVFSAGKWVPLTKNVSNFRQWIVRLGKAGLWGAVAAGAMYAGHELGQLAQRGMDNLALKTGHTRESLEKFQKVSAARFGGKAREELDAMAEGVIGVGDAFETASDKIAAAINALKGPVDVKADIKDVEAKIAKVKARLADLQSQPRTAEVIVKIEKAKQRLRELQGDLDDIHAEHDPILIQTKIDKAKGNIHTMEALLKKLNNQKSTPRVEADKKKLEAAIAAAKENLAKLQRQKTEAKIEARDYATATAAEIRRRLVATFASTIVQNVSVGVGFRPPDTAEGGVFNGRQLRYIGEAGPEAVIPLSRDKRDRAEDVMSEAGIGGLTVNFNGDIVGIDAYDVADQVVRILNQQQRRRARGAAA